MGGRGRGGGRSGQDPRQPGQDPGQPGQIVPEGTKDHQGSLYSIYPLPADAGG